LHTSEGSSTPETMLSDFKSNYK